MQTERRVRLFKNGRNQALRIPKDFELPGDEAIIRKEGAQCTCPAFYGYVSDISISGEDVHHARNLSDIFPELMARDFIHLSVCQRHRITEIKTFDQSLNSAFSKNSRI